MAVSSVGMFGDGMTQGKSVASEYISRCCSVEFGAAVESVMITP